MNIGENGVHNGLIVTPKAGQRVMVFTPENPRLHGTEATVKETYQWGAVLYAPAAGSGEFRALWEEMRPMQETVRKVPTPLDSAELGERFLAAAPEPTDLRDAGYTGDICDKCGSGRVLRSGPCLKCVNCGEAGGCG